MARFFIPEDALEGERVVLRGGDAHHARRVLRLAPGDRIRAVLPDGTEAEVLLEREDGEGLWGLIVARRRPDREPRLRICLAQALIKGDKFDWVVRKGTEVGVASFVPFRCARAVVDLDAARAARRVERWRRVAREAAEQSGRLAIPEVAEVADFGGLLERVRRAACALLCWEGEENRGLYDALARVLGPPAARARTEGDAGGGGRGAGAAAVGGLLLIVGPEGGFEQREAAALVEAGAVPVSLGPLIFRTETAGLAAAVMALYHAGDLGRAPPPAPADPA